MSVLDQIIIPRKSRKPINLTMVSTIIILVVFGLIMIYSASSFDVNTEGTSATHFVNNQRRFAILAVAVMFAVSYLDYRFVMKWVFGYYGLALFLLVLVRFIGRSVKGQARWIRIAGFNFQPSEFAKLVIIIMLAVILTNLQKKVDTLFGVMVIAAVIAPVIYFIGISNFSTAIIIGLIAFGMMFISSEKPWLYIGIGVAALGILYLFPLIYPILSKLPFGLKAYQMNRIKIWMNPYAYSNEGGRQVLDALYAIGSGGPLGRGLGASIKKRYGMSEAHNDMIFAIIVEELGLVGGILLIMAYLFLLYQIMDVARKAPDKYGLMLVSGIMIHFAIQIILNIMVATNSMPNTGVSLPFVSYGGTSLLMLMVEMGMVLGVQRKK